MLDTILWYAHMWGTLAAFIGIAISITYIIEGLDSE